MATRSKEIAAEICRAILAHRLAPGTKLTERELAAVFGVSGPVVRQALIRLAEDGLVTLLQNRGAFVAKPSLAEASEIFDALTKLEQGILVGLAARPGRSLLTELRANVERQRKALDQGKEELSGEFGLEFHDLLAGLTRNRVVIEMHAQLKRRARLLETLFEVDFDHCRLCADHARLVDLIDRRQLARALHLLDEHYRLVARGYRIEAPEQPALPLARALRPAAEGGSADILPLAPVKRGRADSRRHGRAKQGVDARVEPAHDEIGEEPSLGQGNHHIATGGRP